MGGMKWGGGVRGGRLDIWTARISVTGLFHMADLCPDRNPPFHPPVALGCRRRPAHSRIGSLGSSLFHYAHNLQLRHVRLVSLSSFVAPPHTVLLLLCI